MYILCTCMCMCLIHADEIFPFFIWFQIFFLDFRFLGGHKYRRFSQFRFCMPLFICFQIFCLFYPWDIHKAFFFCIWGIFQLCVHTIDCFIQAVHFPGGVLKTAYPTIELFSPNSYPFGYFLGRSLTTTGLLEDMVRLGHQGLCKCHN